MLLEVACVQVFTHSEPLISVQLGPLLGVFSLSTGLREKPEAGTWAANTPQVQSRLGIRSDSTLGTTHELGFCFLRTWEVEVSESGLNNAPCVRFTKWGHRRESADPSTDVSWTRFDRPTRNKACSVCLACRRLLPLNSVWCVCVYECLYICWDNRPDFHVLIRQKAFSVTLKHVSLNGKINVW